MKVLLHTIPKENLPTQEPTSHVFTKETTLPDDVLSSLVTDSHNRVLLSKHDMPMTLVDIAKTYVVPVLRVAMGDHAGVGCLTVMGECRVAKIRLTQRNIINTKVSGRGGRVLNNYAMVLDDGWLASVLITTKLK